MKIPWKLVLGTRLEAVGAGLRILFLNVRGQGTFRFEIKDVGCTVDDIKSDFDIGIHLLVCNSDCGIAIVWLLVLFGFSTVFFTSSR